MNDPQEPTVEIGQHGNPSGTLTVEVLEDDNGKPGNVIATARSIPKPATGKQGQPIDYYVENGIEMRKYPKSGVIQQWSEKLGKWVFAPGTAKAVITAENASQIAKSRWDERQEAAMLGLMDETGSSVPNDAVRKLTQVAAKHAIAGGRGGSSYLQHVREMAGLVPEKARGDSDLPPNSIRLTLTGSIEDVRRATGLRYAPQDAVREDVTPKVDDAEI